MFVATVKKGKPELRKKVSDTDNATAWPFTNMLTNTCDLAFRSCPPWLFASANRSAGATASSSTSKTMPELL